MNKLPGKILKAPEYFLTQKDIQAVKTQAPQGRRDFIAKAFTAAAAVTATAASTIPQIAPAARVKITRDSRFSPATSAMLGIIVMSFVPR